MRIATFIACLCLLPTRQVAADDALWPRVTRAEVEHFVHDRAGNARELLFGPTAPRANAPNTEDCIELYNRRVALLQQQVDHGSTGFWDDPRNQAGAFIGAVWTPAFYYLPYRALATFTANADAPQRQADIDALRAAAATQRCFER